MSKNSTLRALFVAIQKGDLSAALPLADHLDELGALDLATHVREAIPRDGWELVEAVVEVFEVCHAVVKRDLLRWEEEPCYRRTLALHRAILALPLGDVPVMADAIDPDDHDRWVWLTRRLFRRLKLRGIEVGPRRRERVNQQRGVPNPCILIGVPRREEVYLEDPDLHRKLLDEEGREGKRVMARVQSVLARAFPSVSIDCPRRRFTFYWFEPGRWRLLRERWSPPELALWQAEEAAETVR
jgi:hypothetical protein